MEDLGLLLLKSAAWLTGFALVYLLLLRNERYFQLNRFFLLTGIVASLLFPFYTFHYNVVVPSTLTESASVGQLEVGSVIPSEPTIPFYFWIYLFGIAAFMLRLLIQTWRIIRKLQKSGYEQAGAVKLVRTAEYASSFSFFSFVFVNPSTANIEMEEIMNHEREHIQQRHWFDLLLVELICIVQWFNPFAWIYAHLIRQNHEYLADESALQRTANPAIYQATLLNQLLGAPVFSLTNSFSYSLNKKRFKMMKKKIDSPFRKLKMLVVLPLAAMLFYAFAVPEYQYGNENSSVSPEEKTIDVKGQVVKSDGNPLPGTSVILKGSTLGTISDPQGNFTLKGIPSDGELVFSFVGFMSKVQKVSGEPMKIVMEVSKVGIDQVTVVAFAPPPPPLAYFKNNIDNANPPLIVLDGIPITKAAMDKINPEQIASINVLKDKSATDLYGDQGKYGVIQIVTKKQAGTTELHVTSRKNNDGVFWEVEEMPQFPGGEMALRKFISENIKYPAEAKDKGIQGKVFVNFVIKENGKVEKTKVVRNAHPLLDAEALRVINLMPDWTPGKQSGKAVSVSYTVPVQFALDGDKNARIGLFPQAPKVPVQRPDGVFVVVEEMPQFPGNEMALRKFISENIKYPAEAKDKGIQGKVFVTFTVKSDGTVGDAKIARSVDPLLDNEALRVINQLPTWTPGKQSGQAVDVSYTVPVQFALKNGTAQTGSYVPPKYPEKTEKQVFIVVEEMPEFPGGSYALRTFIAREVKYPGEAQKNKIQGKVFVSFVVNSTGKVEQAKIEKGVDPLLDAEAIRVINQMPDWKPGKQRGQAVNVAFTVPIEFKLQ
jgi:TonB family protein